MEDGKIARGGTGPAAMIDEAGWTRAIEVEALSQLFLNPQGQPLPVSHLNADDALRFVGPRGGVSRTSAGARPGDIFRATTAIRVDGEGDILPAHFGAMFLGPRDEILTHSVVIDWLERDTVVPVSIEMRAPDGAVAVRLRIFGGWAQGKDTSTLTYSYGVARLYRRTADFAGPTFAAPGRG